MKQFILIAALFAASHASARDEAGRSQREFKAYAAPDIALDRFQAGQLGVLQPGMKRVYLYTAWRVMSQSSKGPRSFGMPGGLARADGSAFYDELKSVRARLESDFDPTPDPSHDLAVATSKAINKRKDVTPGRVKAWSDAQDLVSMARKVGKGEGYPPPGPETLLALKVPAELSGSEPAYWRELRQYQRAATQFYAERYADATALFDQIGASRGHPMHDLGQYLALRSQIRLAVKQWMKAGDANRQRAYAALGQRGHVILADASLRALHDATRAALRSARARLTPQSAFAELNHYLANPAADPFADDRLGDWAVILRESDWYADLHGVDVKAARSQYTFVDWIENLRNCAYPDDDDTTCRSSARHARLEWQRTRSRPWLVAAMMTAQTLTPSMEKAALAVTPAHAEYLTVRYHLARLYRLAGRDSKARAVGDRALMLTMSPGSRNLFREERFAVATSLADAAVQMLRVDIERLRNDAKPVQALNDDALDWLNYRLAAADLVVLARQPVLDAALRARLAGAALIRAELLGKHKVALQAVDVMEPLAPLLTKAFADYRNAGSPAARRHVMLLAALGTGLSPQVSTSSAPIELISRHDVVASNWCSFKAVAYDFDGGQGEEDSSDETETDAAGPAGMEYFPWRLPPSPRRLGDQAAAKDELVKLAPFKTATGFIGDHVMLRAKSHAGDPDLPWLLHVVVRSTRGGCIDLDVNKLSRAAFGVLHKRFPRDAWTRKTKYFY